MSDYEIVDKLPESAVPMVFDRGHLRLLTNLAGDDIVYMMEQDFGEAYIYKLREVDGD